MVVYDKIFSVVQDSRMRSLCNNMVVLYVDRIIIKSTKVLCTPLQQCTTRKYKIFVYIPSYSNMVAVRRSY